MGDAKEQDDDFGDFCDLNLSMSFDKILSLEKRTECPKCTKRRPWYCCHCKIPLLNEGIPTVKLPIDVDIIHHPGENLTKSTAVHATILAPSQSVMHEFPHIPQYDPETTLLLFPTPESTPVSELTDVEKFSKLVVVDSTWFQCNQVVRDPRLAHLKCVRFPTYRTRFWRYQSNVDNTHLATIEAIYYFQRHFYERKHGGAYKGEVDDLLFFFALQSHIIRKRYREHPEKLPTRMRGFMANEARKRKRRKGGASSQIEVSAQQTIFNEENESKTSQSPTPPTGSDEIASGVMEDDEKRTSESSHLRSTVDGTSAGSTTMEVIR